MFYASYWSMLKLVLEKGKSVVVSSKGKGLALFSAFRVPQSLRSILLLRQLENKDLSLPRSFDCTNPMRLFSIGFFINSSVYHRKWKMRNQSVLEWRLFHWANCLSWKNLFDLAFWPLSPFTTRKRVQSTSPIYIEEINPEWFLFSYVHPCVSCSRNINSSRRVC